MLSQLALSIKESPTLKLDETAALLRDKGEPVIHLGGGEPKSRTPIDAIISCTSLLGTGEVRYTPADGIPALKKRSFATPRSTTAASRSPRTSSSPAAPNRR